MQVIALAELFGHLKLSSFKAYRHQVASALVFWLQIHPWVLPGRGAQAGRGELLFGEHVGVVLGKS